MSNVPNVLPFRPLMCMTDCSPALESAALAAFASEEGMGISRIEYGNSVLRHLLHYDKMIADDPSKRAAAAKIILAKLQRRTGVLLKECTSHVYRAPVAWMKSRKDTEFSLYKPQFQHLMSRLFASILKDNRISEAIVRMSVILAVFKTERFKTPSFSETSTIQTCRNSQDRSMEITHATEIDAFVRLESKALHVHTPENVAESDHTKHLIVHDPIVGRAKKELKHLCVYLSSVSTDDVTGKSMGTLACTVVYGRKMVDGAVTAMTEYGFKVTVKLPHNGDDGIKNPLYSLKVAAYLDDTWMKKISLWSRGIVDLAETATSMKIDPTNQLIEAVFKNVKHNQGVHQHVRDPGEYALHRWRDCQQSEKRFINEYQYLKASLNQKYERRAKKRKKELMSQDVAKQEAEEKTDEVWCRKGSTTEADTRLRNDLISVFRELGLTANLKRHARIQEAFSADKKMKVMSYPTFNNFMNSKEQSRQGLSRKFSIVLRAFVSKHTPALASAAPAVLDPDDDTSTLRVA
jgi:hypothetical protein